MVRLGAFLGAPSATPSSMVRSGLQLLAGGRSGGNTEGSGGELAAAGRRLGAAAAAEAAAPTGGGGGDSTGAAAGATGGIGGGAEDGREDAMSVAPSQQGTGHVVMGSHTLRASGQVDYGGEGVVIPAVQQSGASVPD